MKKTPLALLAGLLAATAMAEQQAFVTTRTLSLASAVQLANTTVESCRQKGYQIAVAVTDRSGNPLVLLRDPLAGHHTIEVARRKAYSAATFQAPTLELQGGRMGALQHTENVLLIGGGVPIRVAGHVYGAVGVSGAPAEKVMGDIDDQCARDGIAAIAEALEFAE